MPSGKGLSTLGLLRRSESDEVLPDKRLPLDEAAEVEAIKVDAAAVDAIEVEAAEVGVAEVGAAEVEAAKALMTCAELDEVGDSLGVEEVVVEVEVVDSWNKTLPAGLELEAELIDVEAEEETTSEEERELPQGSSLGPGASAHVKLLFAIPLQTSSWVMGCPSNSNA